MDLTTMDAVETHKPLRINAWEADRRWVIKGNLGRKTQNVQVELSNSLTDLRDTSCYSRLSYSPEDHDVRHVR